MGRINWIEYKGKKIIHVDYSNMGEADMLAFMDDVEVEYRKIHKDCLVLVDATDAAGTNKVMDKLKVINSHLVEKMSKGAVLGVVGIKKILLKGLNAFLKIKFQPIDSLEEAKEWLVK